MGYWGIEFVEIWILGYWDIDSSRGALDGWMTFRNRDIGISDPLYQGPKNVRAEIENVTEFFMFSISPVIRGRFSNSAVKI